ncbi:hypothetical protein NUV25_12110 [Burkholderia pseudomultivorans]|uniref:hypothetical protein n=1 Tax=Burkholderia pseudomultivorans TaxID=1207504 RepID=UPI00287552EB|nr:hypothetical protein [Burkholderia pseudomultivorans]MDS0858455.1 hypothetical protein [Burkholderia pseudomultivorans]
MKDTTRLRVAAAVGAAALRKNVTAVYDYSSGGYKSISASVGNGSLNGYDYTTSSYFTGSSRTSLDFYDYHNSKYVQLNLKNNSFDGYDYGSGKHFSGTVNGNLISLYDYETSKHYSYAV